MSLKKNFYQICMLSAKSPKMALYALETIAGESGENIPFENWMDYEEILLIVKKDIALEKVCNM